MNTEKKVNVLISSYNGKKYIADQIKSIQEQSYGNVDIYVRDDGSSDGTVELLREYESRGEITFIEGNNIKWGRSFLELLKRTEEGDYWAFCDQDDIWLKDKLRWAVDWFEENDPTTPLLYHGSYELVTEDLKSMIATRKPPKYELTFRRALTECMYQGFSIVINRACRNLMLQGDIQKISSHDQWAGILIAKFGKAFFDPRVSALHRRLDSSMSSESLKSRFKWLNRTMKEGSPDIRTCAEQYLSTFGKRYRDRDVAYARLFVSRRYDLTKSLIKAFYPGRWRPVWSSEIILRILMLLGKV